MSIRDLAYRVVKSGEYVNEDLVEHTDAVASFTLTHGILRAALNSPADSVSEARARIEPVVRAWEFEAEVRWGFPVISFEFTPAVAVEMPPPLSPAPAEELESEAKVVILSRYPPGPTIAVTRDMENIWQRYRSARLGIGESLQSAVYYGLTVIEAQFGSRTKAAAALNLPSQLLSRMGELSSTRGDFDTARKARAAGAPLSRAEKKWIDHAVRHALLQLGHLASGLSPPRVDVTELPLLE